MSRSSAAVSSRTASSRMSSLAPDALEVPSRTRRSSVSAPNAAVDGTAQADLVGEFSEGWVGYGTLVASKDMGWALQPRKVRGGARRNPLMEGADPKDLADFNVRCEKAQQASSEKYKSMASSYQAMTSYRESCIPSKPQRGGPERVAPDPGQKPTVRPPTANAAAGPVARCPWPFALACCLAIDAPPSVPRFGCLGAQVTEICDSYFKTITSKPWYRLAGVSGACQAAIRTVVGFRTTCHVVT